MKFINKVTAGLLSLIIIFILCSCSSNQIDINIEQNADAYVENEDCQNYINVFSSFVKVDDGYYFISDAMLFFFDVQEKESYPVCSKTNCDHSDSDCTAYLSPLQFYPGMSMHYYNNALYLVGREDDASSCQKVYMYQISLENFKRKKAAYLFDSTNGISMVCTIHRGYIYFANCTGLMEKSTATLYRVKLGETHENSAEKVFEFQAIGADIANLSAFGNYLFFNTSFYEDKQGNGYQNILNYIDIHTLEKNTISERKYSHFADQNRVYYCKDENTINYYDLKKNINETFCNIKGPSYISADNSYVYFDNLQSIYIGKTDEKDRKILVYDKSGNYITEIVPKNPKDDCYFGGDDIMIFKEIITGEVVESDGAKGYYVLDKSQLTSPDKQFIDMK